jgi:hypothetical protein
LLASNAAVADEWSDGDVKREAAYLALHIIDYGQTRTIALNPDRLHEQNSILGLHPTVGQVNRYFLLTGIAHVVVMDLLPSEWRRDIQNITIGIEAGAVGHNFSIGISVSR